MHAGAIMVYSESPDASLHLRNASRTGLLEATRYGGLPRASFSAGSCPLVSRKCTCDNTHLSHCHAHPLCYHIRCCVRCFLQLQQRPKGT